MENPRVVVIDDDKSIRDYFNVFFNGYAGEIGIDFRVDCYESCPKIDEISDASLYFIDYSLNEETGLDIARRLNEEGVLGAKVMITGYSGEKNEDGMPIMQVAMNEGLVDAWVDKSLSDNKTILGVVKSLRKERKLVKPISLGVFGMGYTGTEIIRRFKGKSWCSKVHGFSNHLADSSYKSVKTLIGMENAEKVEFHSNLEDFVESNPDLILVATGKPRIPYSEYITRHDNSLIDDLLEGSRKTDSLFKGLVDSGYEGLVCVFTNPVGATLQRSKELGLNPIKLTGISTDAFRAGVLIKKSPRKLGDNIKVCSAGEHGDLFFLYRDCSKDGGLLVYPSLRIREMAEEKFGFKGELRRKGLEDMIAFEASDLQIGYEDAIKAVMKILDDIACLQESPRESIYCYFGPRDIGPRNNKDAFLCWPTEINYPSLEIRKLKDLSVNDLSDEDYATFMSQVENQNALFERLKQNARE